MFKNTLKLDAICAKLSKGLSGVPPQEEPRTGATLPGSNGSTNYSHQDREACKPDAPSKTLHNGDISLDRSAQLPTVQATENNGYMDNELSAYRTSRQEYADNDGEDDSRCSSPKILSGASKRKARQRATRIAESSSEWDKGSVNSYQDCDESVDSVESQDGDQTNGLEHWEEEQEEQQEEQEALSNEYTQELNHYDKYVSMQNVPYTHASYEKATNGNNAGHSISSSSKEADSDAYQVAGHGLRVRSSKIPIYDETGLSDEEEGLSKATYDPRAIMEYAERSWCNENGTEIEEGLETSDVICEIEESGRPNQGQEVKHKKRRGRPSKSEQMRMVGEEQEDQRQDTPEVIEKEEEPEEPMETSLQVDPEEEQEVEFVDDADDQPEPVPESPSPSPPPATSHSLKEGQTAPGAPYDEGLEAVKEYASDTMKEFLGMYGYMEDGSGAREEDFPLDHLSKYLCVLTC